MKPTGAVFLSYASEDAEAAQRIAEALKSAGIDAWFDRSELRGGEAWDRKIRQQIRDCGLFIPIISAQTQARQEGYFRLEWHLADLRTHLMGRQRPFIVPVCIDGTPERDADIPDSFVAVQWMRVTSDEATAAFARQVSGLLAGPSATVLVDPAPRPKPESQSSRPARGPAAVVLIAVTVAALAAAIYAWRAGHAGSATLSTPTPPAGGGMKTGVEAERSIAVLPFVDLSEKHDQAYFSDGLAEELLDLLAKTPGLRVTARTSSFSFKGKSEDVPTIAGKLHVDHILEGSVRKSGTRLRVTTQLIRGDTGAHEWSETYDRTLTDVFKVQDEIAAAVVNALRLKLTAQQAAPHRLPQIDAYNAYLLGKQFWNRGDSVSWRRAIAEFRRSIELDPEFAAPYAGLATIQATLANDSHDRAGVVEAERIASRAIKLAPNEADGYAARAWVRQHSLLDLAGARHDVDRAVELDPGSTVVQRRLADVLGDEGRVPEALEAARRAVDLDPLSAFGWQRVGNYLFALDRFDEARDAYQRQIEITPEDIDAQTALTLATVLAGKPADLSVLNRHPNEAFRLGAYASVWAKRGDLEKSDEYLRELVCRHGGDSPYQIAMAYETRHDMNECFRWLNRALELHDPDIGHIQVDWYDNPAARRDPRYAAILAKLHMVAPSETR
ncbi:MAG: TIR domain-containing protein [Cyanobacteria bacterium SZAS LIN-2]|nr:TIR domain-containing protein [Cyanobacteria bacterium SZAS LIN-2]